MAQVQCARHCGFRVHDRYFEEKKRFLPGICPRCNAPIEIVEDWTDDVIAGAYMVLDPTDRDAGQIKLS